MMSSSVSEAPVSWNPGYIVPATYLA
jgi:hypothetical protein